MTIKTAQRLAALVTATALAVTLASCARQAPATSGGTDSAEAVPASPGITDTTITLGSTNPLTGNAAGVGNCAADGAAAYFAMKNEEGGIEFGDGKTRTVDFITYDDKYDPQRSLANFQQMTTDGVFAAVLSLGTPTNRAWRDAAIAAETPQVLLQTGDPIFSDREESPWQLGLLPIYQQEGEAFGELLAASLEDHRVAILYQNDDFGEGYVEGFLSAVEGADNVEIVKQVSYEATATDVSAQITDLASTDADIFFNAMSSLAPLVIGSLQQANNVGWNPSWFLPSTTSSPQALLIPSGVADSFPAIYTTASSQNAAAPSFAESDEGQRFLEALAAHTNQTEVPTFPQCLWSWIGASVLEEAFGKMTEPTRENFMESLMSISDFAAPGLLPGDVIDTTVEGRPAMGEVAVMRFNGSGFDLAEELG
jgi:branched-chain amino acid transport system substrate-binding protein